MSKKFDDIEFFRSISLHHLPKKYCPFPEFSYYGGKNFRWDKFKKTSFQKFGYFIYIKITDNYYNVANLLSHSHDFFAEF